MTHIILVEPEIPGNIGAVARVMKNFNQKNLILLNPKCDHLDQDARNRAKHAQDILNNTKIIKTLDELNLDYLIATTAMIGTDFNIPRSPLDPEQMVNKIKNIKNTGILIGREGPGLSNEEIKQCDFCVKIPSSKEYPTLNISHACAIICYELFKSETTEPVHTQASAAEKEQLQKMINEVLNKLEFSTEEKKETQTTVWKKIIGKSTLTKREAFALMGFFRKL